MTILEKQGPSTAPYAGDNTKGEGDHMKANEYGNEVSPVIRTRIDS